MDRAANRQRVPFRNAAEFLLRDRDGIYGAEFTKRVTTLGIVEKPIAPRAPLKIHTSKD